MQVLEHQGKSDLEKSVKRKINGWKAAFPAYFIVLRDSDSADIGRLKAKLLGLVPDHARERTKVRIVIPELEIWYLGDPEASVASGLVSPASASRLSAKAKFRNLCALTNAKQEFHKLLVQKIGQIEAAHRLGPLLRPARNSSLNFHAFVAALAWAAESVPPSSAAGAEP